MIFMIKGVIAPVISKSDEREARGRLEITCATRADYVTNRRAENQSRSRILFKIRLTVSSVGDTSDSGMVLSRGQKNRTHCNTGGEILNKTLSCTSEF